MCVLIMHYKLCAVVEAESDTECRRFDWRRDGWSAAQLWMFHQVTVGVLAILIHMHRDCHMHFSRYVV